MKLLIASPCLILFLIVSFFGCKNDMVNDDATPKSAAMSLMGQELFPLAESDATTHKKDSLYQVALKNFQTDSTDLDNIIWLGRRLAYQYKYKEAIDIYTKGLAIHPEDPRLYRHRGHRYISIREFEKAISDFETAARYAEGWLVEIEPDGQPNQLNIPLSTLQFNIYYHWGLAHYLLGDFEKAARIYDICMTYSTNNDLLLATTDWYYMTLRRLGQEDKALALLDTVTADMEIIENASYHKRILMYKEIISADDLLDLDNNNEDAQVDIVTQGYGVANWHLYSGRPEVAREIFEKILACDYWPAFGYIAAEADYVRMK